MDRAAATTGLDVVASGEAWCVARNAHVLVVVLDGDITDEVSTTWQAAVQNELDEHGAPSFGVVVAIDAISHTSLGNRVKTASFTKRSAQAMKKLVMIADDHGGVVINAVLRVARIDNVRFIDRSQAARVIAALATGLDPFS